MLNLPLQNISNSGREIILFNRQSDGKLSIMRDSNFFPYYYQESPSGIFRTIDNKKVNKITCKLPSEIANKRDENSYEADVLYPKRYMIDKIGNIIKSAPKCLFVDIEMQTTEGIPNFLFPEQIITCISIYNNYTKEKKTWFILDNLKSIQSDVSHATYEENLDIAENELLRDVIKYIKEEQPDILLGWNFVNFDYLYFAARIKKLWDLELAELISPIGKCRWGKENIPFPAGISILDYMDLFKKVYKSGEISYALEVVSNKYVKFPLAKKVDFKIISQDIKEKNIQDVDRMIQLEEKLKLILYYDELRRMGGCLWEDLTWYSKVLDVMLLKEAKSKGIVLPSKKYKEIVEEMEEEVEDEQKFEGAYRRADLGRFETIQKLDLASAYPQAIIDFCLDISNLTDNINEQKIDITDRKTEEIKYSIYVKQNPTALLPTIARKLIAQKNILKKQLGELDPESPEAKDLQIKYDATKALVNSLFGVCALKVFRLYNINIASAITSIVRDLLHYVEDKLQEKQMKVTYLDTDSIFVNTKENPEQLLNGLVKQWIKEKYNRELINIEFDYEGYYEKIFVLALCHYKGILKKKNGKTKTEIKGIEVKRKDSSIFMRDWFDKGIDKVINGESEEQLANYINLQKEEIKKQLLINIGFPAKVKMGEYDSPPIFVRALQYTNEILPFRKVPGDLFYWIYVESFGKAERHAKQMRKNKETGKKELKESHTTVDKDVLAFDEEKFAHIKEINWNKMIERTILKKAEHIFEAMGWELSKIVPPKVKKERKKKND